MVLRHKFGTNKFGTFKFGEDSTSVTINGVEVYPSEQYIEDLLNSEVNTYSFTLVDIYANRPLQGQEVIVTHWENTVNVRLFAGRVKSVTPSKLNNSAFLFLVECVDYTADLDKKLVKESYENKSTYYIINDIITNYTSGFTVTGVENPGQIIEKIQFNYLSASECIQQLADYTGYDWYVDYYKDLKFFSLATPLTNAPIELLDNGLEFDELEISFDNTQIKNRVYVRGSVYYSSPYSQTYNPDAGQDWIPIAYKPTNFSITVDGVPKTVGIENIDAYGTKDFLLNYNEKLVRTSIIFAGTEVIVMTYEYEIPVIVKRDNGASQTAIATIEGGDGIYEFIIYDKTITSLAQARQRADGELALYANTLVEGSFITLKDGFRSGQRLHIQLTDRNINEYYLIKEVSMTVQGGTFFYSVKFATLLLGFTWFLLKLLDATKPKEDIDNQEILDLIETMDETITTSESTASQGLTTPPFVWSNDAGTTPNKMIWNEFQWA